MNAEREIGERPRHEWRSSGPSVETIIVALSLLVLEIPEADWAETRTSGITLSIATSEVLQETRSGEKTVVLVQ